MKLILIINFTLKNLDETGRETLSELIKSDPSAQKEGPLRVIPPKPIRAGRLVIELFDDKCPKTAENFRGLASGEMKNRSSQPNKYSLHYANCKIHRVEKGFVCQGGDFVRGDGSGGESIWKKPFKDEPQGLKLKHDDVGVLSMANSGKNSNTSQFFITFGPQPKLDGKYVVFGKVVDGLDVLKKIEAVGSSSGVPTETVVIADCGLL
eukprot:TRINITY_DN476_c0_g1_i1.p1 TRINITY_DN476_c0_g1~~TRINITY_DN476_c0_g1_i1.p1  ORF type:complete len:208 (-),score=40.37 TRINITY_DN476_c0_g1_i1:25-648(-)